MEIAAAVPALLAGGAAQAIKLTLAVRRVGELGPRTLINLPGMPSTWAAMCGALCTMVAARERLDSETVAMTVAFSSLVLYDALKLRRSAGRQARLLNAIARDLELHQTHAAGRHLRELLGETPAQVSGGLVVGILVALPWVFA
jgi:acid phosphatase family membrane protein YuiD